MPRRKPVSVAKQEAIGERMNTGWFYSRMDDVGISLRGTAARMGMDPAALSRRLHGKAPFDLYEAVDLAQLLDTPFMDIVRHCGVEPPIEPDASTPIVGTVDASGLVEFKKRMSGPSKVRRPFEAPARLVAVRVEAPGAPLDGWIIFYVPTTKVEADAVGRLNIVHANDGRDYLAVLKRGYHRGHWNLQPLSGGPELEDVVVASAAPVLMVRT